MTTTDPDPQPAASAVETPLPCPFCGNTPDIDLEGGAGDETPFDYAGHYFGCTHEACEVNPIATGATRREALAVWNTRA